MQFLCEKEEFPKKKCNFAVIKWRMENEKMRNENMKRNLLIFVAVWCCHMMMYGATAMPLQQPDVQRVEPMNWWVGMQCPLTLMVYGNDLRDARVTIEPKGLIVQKVRNADSKNYVFIDLNVKKAGTYNITLETAGGKTSFAYQICQRKAEKNMPTKESFSSKDMIYLIMSDRFVDGDTTNNTIPGMKEACDKNNIHGRFGGDIQGIINSLDHIAELGATAIWPTPLTWSNDATFSYHGYACADYYHIDPRFGTNELYREMVQKAHAKGLKVIWDVVTNHCGTSHWWTADLPYKDWYHQTPEYMQSNNAFTTWYDPNASTFDFKQNFEGWFDHHMADMNLDNPDLLHYFEQCFIWWIEYADLDGLRVDTYPYNEPEPMSRWCEAIRKEFPWINIVGETWTRPASQVAYWQENANGADGFNTHLPTVMDFPTEEAIRQALENNGEGWGNGLTRVYDALSNDGLYANVNNLLIFVGNHDMERFADIVKDQDVRRVMLGHVLIATMRGIPQMFAGDEYAMRSKDITTGHSGLRQPLPQEKDLTEQQKKVYEAMCQLWQWRQTEPVLWTGKTMHFLARDNTYAYFRYNDNEAVMVFLNANEHKVTVPMAHYREILDKYGRFGQAVLEGSASVDMTQEQEVEPLAALIIKLKK